MVEETGKIRILECCKKLCEHKLTAKGDVCSLRVDGGMIITDPATDIADITEKDIVFVGKNEAGNSLQALHLAIYAHREDVNAIVMNHAPFCVGIAKKLNAVPATLDDMAQIIGPTAKVSPSEDATDILRTLTGRNACLVRNGGVIATGRTLDEAFTGSLVLEKGALCYVGSAIIGKPVKIGLFDAVLMRLVYKLKYSKKDQAAKLKEEQGG